jgi:hypothetical protein
MSLAGGTFLRPGAAKTLIISGGRYLKKSRTLN